MPSFWYFLKDAFGDEILQILCVCAIIEISIGLSPFTENPGYDAFDGIGIVSAIVVIVVTTAVTNYNKEKKFKQNNMLIFFHYNIKYIFLLFFIFFILKKIGDCGLALIPNLFSPLL